MRNRLRVVAALVIALYALAAETSVVRHHDHSFSPKSASSQCQACARGPEVTRIESGFRLDQPTPVELGEVEHSREDAPRTGRALPHAGRAPPA